MKKLLALILALCMALTALSALAEEPAAADVSVSVEDLTGTWYLLMFGLTAGSVELREDGTCTMTIATDGEEEVSPEIAWTLEGNVVSLAVEENTMNLTYDGTNLVLSVEAIEALGGLEGSGLDASMLSSLISFSREPGKLSYAELMAYQADGTIPEGKTEEDMQAALMEMMLLVFSMMGSEDSTGSSGDTSGEDTADPATADAQVTIVEYNCYIRNNYSGQVAYCMVKVQNDTDVPLYLNGGSLKVADEAGTIISETSWYDDIGSRYLEPGEATFISFSSNIPEGAAPTDFEFNVQSSPEGYYSRDLAVEIGGTALDLNLESEYNYDNHTRITVTNNTGDPQENIRIIIAIRDENGELLDVDTNSLYDIELYAGSTVTKTCSIDSYMIEYCKANGIVPASVEAYAWVEVK